MTHTGSSWLSGDVCSPRRLSEQFSLDDLPEQFVLADEPAGPARGRRTRSAAGC